MRRFHDRLRANMPIFWPLNIDRRYQNGLGYEMGAVRRAKIRGRQLRTWASFSSYWRKRRIYRAAYRICRCVGVVPRLDRTFVGSAAFSKLAAKREGSDRASP